MKQLIVMFVMMLFSASLYAYPKDDKKDEPFIYPEGIAYSLPRTGIKIKVVAEKTVRVAGPYAQYAGKYLGIDNASPASSESWEIKNITMGTFAEPDPKQVHKAMGVTAALVNMTSFGTIAGINSEASSEETAIETNNLTTESLTPEYPFTDMSMWGMFTKGDSTNNYRIMSKSTEEKAAEAAEVIYSIRNSRFRLLTNADDEPLPDGKSFEVMARELKEMENEKLALFIGKSYMKSYEYCFCFIPGENDAKSEVVFRFSGSRGVLPKTDLSGKPVIIDVRKVSALNASQKNQLGSQNPNAGESGIFYRMPGQAEVTLSDGVSTIAATRLTIAQFGEVATLPESLLDGSYMIQFHPETGTVKSILPIE